MAPIKGIFLGAILTGVVSLILGTNGASGGVLNVQAFAVQGTHIYWSWPLFLASSLIAWGIVAMMP